MGCVEMTGTLMKNQICISNLVHSSHTTDLQGDERTTQPNNKKQNKCLYPTPSYMCVLYIVHE